MPKLNFEGLLDGLIDLFEDIADGTEKPPSQKELEKKFLSLYEALVGKYRSAVLAGPVVLDAAATDLLPVITSLVKTLNKVRGDKNLRAALAVGQRLQAEAARDALKCYMKAGFKRDEAMAFVLKDTTASSLTASKLLDSIKNASASSKRSSKEEE